MVGSQNSLARRVLLGSSEVDLPAWLSVDEHVVVWMALSCPENEHDELLSRQGLLFHPLTCKVGGQWVGV